MGHQKGKRVDLINFQHIQSIACSPSHPFERMGMIPVIRDGDGTNIGKQICQSTLWLIKPRGINFQNLT